LSVTDTLDNRMDNRKRHAPRKSRWLGVFAVLFGVAMLAGPQVRPAAAQGTHTRVTAVIAKPKEPTLSVTGTAATREPTSSALANASATSPNAAAAKEATPPTTATASAPKSVSKLAGRYFVDFRSRTAASYGHAFLWYGRLTASGKVHEIEVAGLHPATDSPIPYIIGHIFPVPSETGKSYGDLDEQYLTASYRVYLSEADAKQVFAYIQHLQASSPLWLASVYNCTAFLADVARFMGMKTPAAPTWMYPETFVNTLRELNNGRTEIVVTPQSDDLISRFMR
jgi:hypothetical protein